MGCSLFKRCQSLQALSLGSFSARVLVGKESGPREGPCLPDVREGVHQPGLTTAPSLASEWADLPGSGAAGGRRRQLAAGGLDATSE